MLSIQTYQYMNNRSREYSYETVKWKERMRLEWVAAVMLVRGVVVVQQCYLPVSSREVRLCSAR